MKRIHIALLTGTLMVSAGIFAAERHPLALKAEASFFEALNKDPRLRKSSLRDLNVAYAVSPNDARTNLWLGLDHLWVAAESDHTNPAVIEDLILAERYFTRAQELNPSDHRIASWLVPTRLGLARIRGDVASQKQITRELDAAYKEHPEFHSFSVALLSFEEKRDSKTFQRGLEVLQNTKGCADYDPSCQNKPHWPHNEEGFLLFLADYQLKKGSVAKAQETLQLIQKVPEYHSWKFAPEVDARLQHLEEYAARYANNDPDDDPSTLARSQVMCQMCHLGS